MERPRPRALLYDSLSVQYSKNRACRMLAGRPVRAAASTLEKEALRHFQPHWTKRILNIHADHAVEGNGEDNQAVSVRNVERDFSSPLVGIDNPRATVPIRRESPCLRTDWHVSRQRRAYQCSGPQVSTPVHLEAEPQFLTAFLFRQELAIATKKRLVANLVKEEQPEVDTVTT